MSNELRRKLYNGYQTIVSLLRVATDVISVLDIRARSPYLTVVPGAI